MLGGEKVRPFAVDINLQGYRKIGNSNIPAMTIEGRGTVFGNLELTRLKREPVKELVIKEIKPFNLKNKSHLQLNRQWEKLGDKFVADGVVYFNSYLTPAEVKDLFSKYDLRLTWLAVDTGSKRQYAIGFPLDFPFAPVKTGIISYKNGENYVTQTAKTFLNEIKWLGKNYDKYKNSNVYHSQLKLDQVSKFISKKGIRIYAAVITGPTNEIIKLLDDEKVGYVEPGEVKPYN